MKRPAFGHTGFTGTSFWVDPSNDVFVILLTNRVNPTRANTKIGRVRQSVADAVVGLAQSGR
jgi:CubicO group peptidase (beta-lactamase class C family)